MDKFKLSKRQKILIASVLVSAGLLSTRLIDFDLRFKYIAGLCVFAYLLFVWALWSGLNRTKSFVLMILPVFFTLSVASFYFLIEARWLKILVAGLFGVILYLILLAENVFNVAAIRTIPLYRAAHTTTFIFTFFSAFFIYSVIEAFNLIFLLNGVLVAAVSFPMILHLLWSHEMEDKISSEVYIQSLILSLIMGELALVMSFWPTQSQLKPYALGAMLTSSLYVLLGMASDFMKQKLNRREAVEYVVFGFLVWIVAFLATTWTE